MGTRSLEVLLVFVVFAVYGARPVPDANETGYLGKAKHLWTPSWVEHDLFFDSADVHFVFYASTGWLTSYLSLPAFAWLGRLATWLILAWAWMRLCNVLLLGAFLAPLSACLFVMLNHYFRLSGEWIIGGFEAKPIAYALVFFGMEALLRRRWSGALVFFGAAMSMHILVGGWAFICALVIGLFRPDCRLPIRRAWPAICAAGLLASPTLLIAWQLGQVDDKTAIMANEIYVFDRAPHHLLPDRFPRINVVRYTVLLIAWALLTLWSNLSRCQRIFRDFVCVAIGIGLIGFALRLITVNDNGLSAWIMRLHWFRLPDVIVPCGVAILIVFHVQRIGMIAQSAQVRTVVTSLCLIPVAAAQPLASIALGDRGIPNLVAWREVCQWIAHNTSADACFVTPSNQQTFKWYAERGEVVSWKHIPVAPVEIIEWKERLKAIREARRNANKSRLVAQKYGAQYVLTEEPFDSDLGLCYWNRGYWLYRVPDKGP